MLELLQSVLNTVLGLLQAVWDLGLGLGNAVWDAVNAVVTFASVTLLHLHTESPRLEGLLLGVGLAWLLGRRDSHPLLRVLSSPLKLILDILDLAWDQVVEVVTDAWGVVVKWVGGALGWGWNLVKGVWGRVIGALTSLRNMLRR